MRDYTHLIADYPDEDHRLHDFLKEYEDFKGEYVAPARKYEAKSKLKGLAAHWKMPDGLDEAAFQKKLSTLAYLGNFYNLMNKIKKRNPPPDDPIKPYIDKIVAVAQADLLPDSNAMLDRLIEVNPELASYPIDRSNVEDVRNLLYGVASQFNLDDIDFFIKHPYNDKTSARHHPAYKAINRIHRAGWIPSPETYKKIDEQLGNPEVKIEGVATSSQTAAGAGLALAGLLAFAGSSFKKSSEPSAQDKEESSPKKLQWGKVLAISLGVTGGALLMDKFALGGSLGNWLDKILLKRKITGLDGLGK